MKVIKIMTKILIIIFVVILINKNCILASAIDTDFNIGTTNAIKSSNDVIGKSLKIFQIIGSILSVVAILVIGFRYVFSSLEEKAKMKGVLIYYIVGAVLVFATVNILSVVYNVIFNI